VRTKFIPRGNGRGGGRVFFNTFVPKVKDRLGTKFEKEKKARRYEMLTAGLKARCQRVLKKREMPKMRRGGGGPQERGSQMV